MDYRQALGRLYGLSHKGVTLGLERVFRAATLLDNPERCFKSVQVAGTNGKGTVCATLAHALSLSSVRTGLFTSPHLHRFAERIRVNDGEAPEAVLAEQLSRVLDLNDSRSDLSLSFFEIATLAALLTFKEMDVEIAVLEVGLGGRLDATCQASPALTALTSVALDHTALLGDTIEQIAVEKAGIARPGIPLIAGALPVEALRVVERICEDTGAPISVFGKDFLADPAWRPPWPGAHHASNLAVAAALYRQLGSARPTLKPETFAQAVSTVKWPGRFEIIETDRRYILDCAHNLEAAHALLETLATQGIHPELLIFGALRDKPAKEMLALHRNRVKRAVLMPPPIDRAEDPARLAAPGDIVVKDAAAALDAARRDSTAGSTVLITGSLFTVAKIRELLLGELSDPQVGL